MTIARSDLYIGGAWVPSHSGDVVTLTDPAREQILGTAPAGDPSDVDAAVAAARRAYDTGPWGRSTPAERADAMRRLAAAILERADVLAELVSREMGMPITASRFNNAVAPLEFLGYYEGLTRDLAVEEQRDAVNYPGRTVVRREPFGVVGLIAPWNYPMVLTMNKLAPALAAGCAVVLKPAPETALSALVLAEAVEAAGLPEGVLNLVTGDGAAGEALVRHTGVDKISFTGSTPVGRRIAALCGERIAPVNLELGGKSAAIILADADLDATLAQLAFLSFGNSGQTCFSMSRVLAPRSRYDEVLLGLEQLAKSQLLGDPMDPATTMGPLVTARQRDRVEGYIHAGRTSGARVVTGGGRPADLDRGFYVEPTVFADADSTMAIAREEIFGPVVTVIPYGDDAEAVRIANDSDFGLAASVWTADAERGLDIARHVESGTVGVNIYIPDLGSPWGGYKASGLGRENGPEGLEAYRKTKAIFTAGVTRGTHESQ